MKIDKRACIAIGLGLLVVMSLGVGSSYAQTPSGQQTFPQTGHTVKGVFLQYWQGHGGLAQQGYPLSEEMQESSPLNGKTYTVQYFERAVFELHPENAAPNNVLLSLLGTFKYAAKYPGGAPGQKASTTNARYFAETKHSIGGQFRAYWEAHGGLAQQGYPISDEFQEQSELNGKTYTVQYFERAVFELHPENAAPNNVLLSQLGKFKQAINNARAAAASLSSPPRIYDKDASQVDLWPLDTGSSTTTYSTCGNMQQPPYALRLPGSSRTDALAQDCTASMLLTTSISSSGPDLIVSFASSWRDGQSKHSWQFRIAADGTATLFNETGDTLPFMPM